MRGLSALLRQHGGTYLAKFGKAMPAEHQQVLRAICACRHFMARSCGNRDCPSCQHEKTKAWLEKQTARLLPCPYFLVTFTLPEGLRAFVRAHQRVAYAALFEASSEALKKLAADPKYVGSRQCGFLGVLHTWGRTLEYHPHVHYIVPGGGLSDDGAQWLPSRVDFFVPVRALSVISALSFATWPRRSSPKCT